MRLLVVTQAVDADSSTLGFFIEWLREFSRACESVHVIGLSVGAHDLPSNVTVHSMGKERGAGKLSRLLTYWKLLRRALPETDGVFIHMCPEYLIAGWPFFALARKKVTLWYAHRRVSLRLRLGAWLADAICTIGPGSFPFASPKLRALGHGIPTGRFIPPTAPRVAGLMIAVGRITPIKRLELLIDAAALLREKGLRPRLELWGEAVMPSDAAYRKALETRIVDRDLGEAVVFRGSAPYERMPAIDASASVALNACADGALDKAVLEAMACGTPVVACNRNFAATFGPDAGRCLAEAEAESLADKIAPFLTMPDEAFEERLRGTIERDHSLDGLISRILETL